MTEMVFIDETEQKRTRINVSLYWEYLKQRGMCDINEPILDHPLVGKDFFQNLGHRFPRRVRFIRVSKQWLAGYFLIGVYEDDDGSHGTVVVENINSIASSIVDNAEKFQRYFYPMPY